MFIIRSQFEIKVLASKGRGRAENSKKDYLSAMILHQICFLYPLALENAQKRVYFICANQAERGVGDFIMCIYSCSGFLAESIESGMSQLLKELETPNVA